MRIAECPRRGGIQLTLVTPFVRWVEFGGLTLVTSFCYAPLAPGRRLPERSRAPWPPSVTVCRRRPSGGLPRPAARPTSADLMPVSTLRLRLGDAFALALEHHFALELGEPREDGQDELSGRRLVSTVSPPRLRIRSAAPPSSDGFQLLGQSTTSRRSTAPAGPPCRPPAYRRRADRPALSSSARSPTEDACSPNILVHPPALKVA